MKGAALVRDWQDVHPAVNLESVVERHQMLMLALKMSEESHWTPLKLIDIPSTKKMNT